MNQPAITPKTKVSELLDAYPQLEEVLIGYVPAFEKLKNPVLRKTVARITTLQQAAAVGNVNVEELINRLRNEVGQDLYAGDSGPGYVTEKPDWFSEDLVVSEFDAAEMLAAGEQPVNQVMADLNSLDEGAIYKVDAPFVPAPLLDKASSLGLAHWIHKTDDEKFTIYFYKG
jgi:hypothetical protein